jgi:hypothetical protein
MTIGRPLTSFAVAFDSDGLKRLRAQAEKDFLTAARTAVGTAGRRVEKEAEAAYTAAGLGKLARAWNTKVYPKVGLSEAPTADVRPKGKARTIGAIRAYAEGATIRAKGGGMLAIPLRGAGARYVGRGKVAIGPQEWQRRTGIRLSPAKIGGKLYLVANAVRGKKTGIVARKATLKRLEQGRKVERVLVFLLIEEQVVQQRVDLEPIFARGAIYLEKEFEREVNALLARRQNPGT